LHLLNCIYLNFYFCEKYRMGREDYKQRQFQQLFTENYSQLYYAALYIVTDTEIARDVVHDVFKELWEHYDSEAPKINFSYLYVLTHHKAIDYLRHAAAESRCMDTYIEMFEEMQRSDWDEKDERLDKVYEIMQSLPPRTRFVMEQCYLNEKKYTEVADILGISSSAVKKHIIKALFTIREYFSVNYKKGCAQKADKKR
jgi:RNA polymerase sigma factor (sigma-70 family)